MNEKTISFNGLESALRTAIKLSMFSVKDIAESLDMSVNGLYSFTSKRNHISADKGDKIINFLKEKDPQTFKVAFLI
jgi:hypothetical protein